VKIFDAPAGRASSREAALAALKHHGTDPAQHRYLIGTRADLIEALGNHRAISIRSAGVLLSRCNQ
jgi:hypothetical protein